MRFSELDGRTVGLWGLGREIRSFVANARARLPRARMGVLVLEDPSEDSGSIVGDSVSVVGAADAVAALSKCDVLVRSPGVSIYRSELQELIRAGLAITTPTALWLAEREGKRVIGITG